MSPDLPGPLRAALDRALDGVPRKGLAELAAGAGIGIGEIQPMTAALQWLSPRMSDPIAWRIRAYYAIKVPLAGLSLAVAGVFWLGGLFFLLTAASALDLGTLDIVHSLVGMVASIAPILGWFCLLGATMMGMLDILKHLMHIEKLLPH